MGPLDADLYKSLQAQATAYYDKIQSLWLQKFTLIGAVIVFLFFRQGGGQGAVGAFGLENNPLALVGAVLVPVLSIILDVKVAEFTLHARLVSRFLGQEFGREPVIREWEDTLWSEHRPPNALLLRARNFLTLVSTTVPTLALIGAATAVVALTMPPGAPAPAVTIALGGTVGVGYLAVVVVLWQVVFGSLRSRG